MTTITKLLMGLLLILFFNQLNAQEKIKTTDSLKNEKKANKIAQLNALKIKVEEEEKEQLKSKIELYNKALENNTKTQAEVDSLKNEAAKIHAANIEDKQTIIDKKIAIIERSDNTWQAELPRENDFAIRIGTNDNTNSEFIFIGNKNFDKPDQFDKKTTSNMYYAIGFNNALTSGQDITDTPYKLAGSGFSELGFVWKSRLFKNTDFWRVNYGLALQWNKLNFKDNQYFLNNDGAITLQDFDSNLDKAKFRTTNFVFPLHLEFGPSKKIDTDYGYRYSRLKQFKMGIGGYAGINTASRQKLKFEENGSTIKTKERGGFEVNPFIYGLSTYVGVGNVSLYAKYDINPLFKDQAEDQNNISLGVRLELD